MSQACGVGAAAYGHCLCGAVQYTVAAPFEYAGYCHCPRCRLATGSACSVFAAARAAALRIDAGAELLTIYPRNPDNLSHFCSRCGTLLYAVVREGEYAHVQMGTLVADPGIAPQFHLFAAQKAPWHAIGDQLPQFAGFAP
ncbi:GFA family protein [Niveibacterium sp. SC-1]|uniref:GFA family protein n=1 Tax=Niveibacterium sp. SC-1 TaxID=3135646 RepID=UPI00311E8446